MENKGFTLIELLVAVAVVGVLAAVVLFAVDSGKIFRQTHDARRGVEAKSILDATLDYIVEHKGKFPPHLDATDTPQVIGTRSSGCDQGCAAAGLTTPVCADLGADLVDSHISAMPVDVSDASFSDAFTGYYVRVFENNKIEVGACNPDEAPSIKVKR